MLKVIFESPDQHDLGLPKAGSDYMPAKDLNRVLFVGTGGGNDIFSTLLAKLALWESGWRWKECDIAGVLSPFHRHTCAETAIPGVYRVSAANGRFVPRLDKEIKIGFVDAAVAKMVEVDKSLAIDNVFGLSLLGGSVGLTQTFKGLGRKYDYIVLVDVGGDIFYRGAIDNHILSPMFDAIVLKAFVDSQVPGILFEAGPGTDGEMDHEALETVLLQSGAQSFDLSKATMDTFGMLYNIWIAGTRQGRTVPVTIQAFYSKEPELTLKYRARAHLGDLRCYKEFDQRIKTALCRNFYLVEPSYIHNPFAVSCSSIHEWFAKNQLGQHRTNCEANMEYLEIGGLLYQFLTPSPMLSPDDQLSLLYQGLFELIAFGSCDRVFMFKDDWDNVSKDWQHVIRVCDRTDLFVLFQK